MSIADLKFTESGFIGQDIASLPDRPGESGMTTAELKARFDLIPKMLVALGAINALIDALAASTGAGEIGALVDGLTGDDIQTLLTALKDYIDAHIENMGNPHRTDKEQVGLGKADNTPDMEKPVSNPQREALNGKVDKVAGKGLSMNDFTTALLDKLIGIAVGAQVNLLESIKVNGTTQNISGKTVNIIVPRKVSELSNDNHFTTDNEVLTKTNATVYSPTAPYHPCTKEYADNLSLSAGNVVSVFGRAGAVVPQKGDYTAEMVGAPRLYTTGTEPDDSGPFIWMQPVSPEMMAAQRVYTTEAEPDDPEPYVWLQPAEISGLGLLNLGASVWDGLNIAIDGETFAITNTSDLGKNNNLCYTIV